MVTTPTALRILVWTGVLAATAWAGLGHSTTRFPLPDARRIVVRDLPYHDRDGAGPTLDLYFPVRDHPPATASPAILLVHGGSWIGGSKSSYRSDPWRNPTRLTRHGLVVIAVDYRPGYPGRPSWPDALEDLRAAVRWTRSHAEEYGIDPERIAVLGQSSGAHLAMLLGTVSDDSGKGEVSSKVQAVISFYGPTDLETLAIARRSRRDPIFTLLGHADSGRPSDLKKSASPISRVSQSTCPMLLFHGTDDRWVPADQSRRMSRALEQAGVFHRLVIVEGAQHGFETVVESPRRVDLVPEILAFLQSVWNVSGARPPRGSTPNRASTNDQQPIASRRGPQPLPFEVVDSEGTSRAISVP